MKRLVCRMQDQQGFTLIELVIGMAVIVIIMGAIYGVLDSSLRSQQYNFEESANIQEQRQVIMRISDEIRNSIVISSPAAGEKKDTFRYQKNGDANSRTISVGTGNDANTVVIADPNGDIIERLGSGRTQSIQFTRDNTVARKITVDLTMRNAAKSNAPSNVVSTIVYTLN